MYIHILKYSEYYTLKCFNIVFKVGYYMINKCFMGNGTKKDICFNISFIVLLVKWQIFLKRIKQLDLNL